MISYLCKVAGVSRSGYYKYFSSESKDLRKSREDKDIRAKRAPEVYGGKGIKYDYEVIRRKEGKAGKK